ncbi:phosphatidate cytidylyltransferase [Butyrivibrio sp. WCD3002]|uniref:phosphatidate cytidylyltransferase n=1 Tax=Butyrivibrio sp. WCD3002 TaxID=1280676 RepID=UPI00041EF04E|nr:phosphatidate cytidylyltransferase [Butyrivibrio sp. WCD3002]
MKTRVVSGAVLVVLLAATLLCGGYVTAGVLLFVSLVGYHELVSALGVGDGKKELNIIEILGLIAVIAYYALTIAFGGDMKYLVMTLMFLFFAEAIVFVFTFPKYHSKQLIAAVFSFVYAPVMLSFIYLLRIMPNGQYLAWLPFIAWICDTFAYFAGRAFGKHKLCPKLSPKKTIEGAIGGIAGSVVAGAVFGYVYAVNTGSAAVSREVIAFMAITLVAGALSQIGDLIASGIKRDHDIKDYGNLIPGHGGIMDRFDSVIFITPVIYFMATMLLNV